MSYADGEGKTHNTLRKIMRRRKYWTLLDLYEAYPELAGGTILQTTISTRLSEMKDVVSVRRRLRTTNGNWRWRDCYQLVKVRGRRAA